MFTIRFEGVYINWYNVILVEISDVVNTCHKNHKLPRGQCYHTFSNYWDAYLPKNLKDGTGGHFFGVWLMDYLYRSVCL